MLRCLFPPPGTVPAGTEQRGGDGARAAAGAGVSPQPAPARAPPVAPASTALAPASPGGGNRGRDSGPSGRGWAHGPSSRPLSQRRAPAPAPHRLTPRGPPPKPSAEKRPQNPTHLPSGLDKGYELLRPARSRACVRRGWGRGWRGSSSQELRFPEAPGHGQPPFPAGGSTRGALGGVVRLEGMRRSRLFPSRESTGLHPPHERSLAGRALTSGTRSLVCAARGAGRAALEGPQPRALGGQGVPPPKA